MCSKSERSRIESQNNQEAKTNFETSYSLIASMTPKMQFCQSRSKDLAQLGKKLSENSRESQRKINSICSLRHGERSCEKTSHNSSLKTKTKLEKEKKNSIGFLWTHIMQPRENQVRFSKIFLYKVCFKDNYMSFFLLPGITY